MFVKKVTKSVKKKTVLIGGYLFISSSFIWILYRSKMLLTKLIVSFCTFWLIQCDLLDLYVQHMDETMRTLTYKRDNHQRQHNRDLSLRMRSRRSAQNESPYFKIGLLKKQRLDVDVNYRSVPKIVRKNSQMFPTVKFDTLDLPNKMEKYNVTDQYELIDKYLRNIIRNKSLSTDSKIHAKSMENIPRTRVPEVTNVNYPVVEKNLIKFNRVPKKYYAPGGKNLGNWKKLFKSVKQQDNLFLGTKNRAKRSIAKPANFTRYEILDDEGDVVLEWDPTDDDIVTFKVIAKTLGYVGIGFNDKTHMMGADILIGWVDDHTGAVNLLDSHGILEANASPVTDLSQDVEIIEGYQNDTHTSITFSRKWQTCDPQDRQLSADNVRVLWALHENDPELNTAVWHGERRGGRALRLRAPGPKPLPPISPDVRHWDVKLNQFAVTDSQDTVYWCKIFKAPPLTKKHHMIGYEPLVEKGNRGLVHHMILYECASTLPILGQHARLAGAPCYGATMPREWDSCIQPVVAWARGSRGEWFAEDVGIPIAEHIEGSYYMLEVHYNNPGLKNAIDSSGVRLHLTPNLRPNEAGILVTGVAVNPLHMVPPRQKEYATAGYCAPSCTNALLPEDGVNAVSIVLHSHLAGRRMSLKHIRQGKELPNIVRENHFDFDYQQSHTLEEKVKIMPGDELVTECVYGTQNRTTPTLGGYAATQEMCLAFIVYYPRTELAGCYSITPAKDLFRTLGVHSFKGVTMDHLEKLFLTTGTETVALPTSSQQQLPAYPEVPKSDELDEEIIKEAETALRAMRDYSEDRDSDNVFARLVIEDPEEFRGRTLAEHMLALPWSEELLARSIERSLYHGRHMTFCRKRDDKLALPPDIQMFPNFTALPEPIETNCSNFRLTSGSRPIFNHSSLLIPLVICIISFSPL